MKTRISLAGTLVILAAVGQAMAGPPVDPAKEAHIRQLLEVTGSVKMAQDMMSQMANQLRPMLEKSLPPGEHNQEIADAFVQKMVSHANLEELIERLIPVYDQHLTDDEIQGLIQFYQTPLGQRYVQVMPDMMKQSYAVSAQWGQEIAKQVLDEMREKYPELNSPN
jgi:uncharacterized protein